MYPQLRVEALEPQDVGEDQWGYNGGVRIDHEFRARFVELEPGDFFVGDSPRIRTVRCRRIGDLREVGPEWYVLA